MQLFLVLHYWGEGCINGIFYRSEIVIFLICFLCRNISFGKPL